MLDRTRDSRPATRDWGVWISHTPFLYVLKQKNYKKIPPPWAL